MSKCNLLMIGRSGIRAEISIASTNIQAGEAKALFTQGQQLLGTKHGSMMEWWNGMEWNGMEWNGMEWSGVVSG